jgi:23S rRNA pseudouridine1911/1915/1917 synthase
MSDQIKTENESENENNGEEIIITIKQEDRDQFKRLDQLLADKLKYSRTFIKNLFESDMIEGENLGKAKLSLNKVPPVGSLVNLLIPPPISLDVEAQDIPLQILYEDEHLLFLNKEAGMVVHPAPGHSKGTLVNALCFHCPDLKGIGGVKRPGIVHRLDKGTSGVMVVAKTQECHEKLVLLFSRHDLKREYEALILPPKNKIFVKSGKWVSSIGRHPQYRQRMAANVNHGKEAITHYKILEELEHLWHLSLTLETGRTHQIRVHLEHFLKSPVLMDPLYGSPKDQLKKIKTQALVDLIAEYPYPFLHAKHLSLVHPITGELMSFTQEAPLIFQEALKLAK